MKPIVIIEGGLKSPLPPVVPSNHTYFDTMRANPACVANYSLRDSAQLAVRNQGGYSIKNDTPPAVVYDPAMDAAKVTIKAFQAQLVNQVRLPIPTHAPQSLFVTWDGFFDTSWINGGISDQKTWQLGSPFNDIHLEIRNRYSQGNNQRPGSVARVDGRLYPEGGYSQGPNVTATGTLAPQVGDFFVQPNRWTRWFVFLEAPSTDQWYRYSLWVADTQNNPVKLFDELQVRPSPSSTTASWESFWLEFNTSSNTRSTKDFDLNAWVRNVVVMRGVSDVTPFLQKP